MYVVHCLVLRDQPYFVRRQRTGDGPDVIAGHMYVCIYRIFSVKIQIYLTNSSIELFYLHSEDK